MITGPAHSQTAAARQWFLARQDLGALVEAIRATRSTGHRPHGSGWGDRLRRDPDSRRSARRMAGPADCRTVPAGAQQPTNGFSATRWAHTLEAVHLSAEPVDLDRPSRRQLRLRPARPRRSPAGLPRRSRLRNRRPGHPGSSLPGQASSPTRTSGPGGPAAFIVAVQCTTSSSTCFCTSMGTGPEVRGDYDILLTETRRGLRHPGRLAGRRRDRGRAADPPPHARRGRRGG